MTKTKLPFHSDPEIMSGATVFVGTRVPVSIFWDYIEGGESVEDFLYQYPTVKRTQVIALLKLARREAVESHAHSA